MGKDSILLNECDVNCPALSTNVHIFLIIVSFHKIHEHNPPLVGKNSVLLNERDPPASTRADLSYAFGSPCSVQVKPQWDGLGAEAQRPRGLRRLQRLHVETERPAVWLQQGGNCAVLLRYSRKHKGGPPVSCHLSIFVFASVECW